MQITVREATCDGRTGTIVDDGTGQFEDYMVAIDDDVEWWPKDQCIVVSYRKDVTSRELTETEELTMEEYSGEPCKVPTGIENAAEELLIAYIDGKTYVGPCGEEQNGDDWIFDDYVPLKDVLAQYLADCVDLT